MKIISGTIEDLVIENHETDAELWRWFLAEANKIYRASPKTSDSWNLHKEYKRAAVACCRDGDIPAARAELEKALQALQEVTLTQQNLI